MVDMLYECDKDKVEELLEKIVQFVNNTLSRSLYKILDIIPEDMHISRQCAV
ncbi:hypothetical protein PO909_031612 [Leuciscus waleckii]